MMQIPSLDDTIVAPATAPGQSAIAMVRLSGPESIPWAAHCLGKKTLQEADSHTAHYGLFRKGDDLIDEVVVTLYRGPNSYTRQDVVEISCHGNDWIVQNIMDALVDLGARPAEAGEFTMRAFMNGKMDLSQAEAVGDLIAAESRQAHQLALSQLRGGFSKEIGALRQRLIDFASLIELELDFGEEDVEFADRKELVKTVEDILLLIRQLIDSFRWGNAVKKGIRTVIAGRPNAGKSTLLNALLKEDRAIVSDIAGTTRDTIEESIVLDGIQFRLIDTAGIRDATDRIESLGVQRTFDQISTSAIVIFIFDAATTQPEELKEDLQRFQDQPYHLIVLANKIDLVETDDLSAFRELVEEATFLPVSAIGERGISSLLDALRAYVKSEKYSGGSVVTNTRHLEALQKARGDLQRVIEGLEGGVTSDFVAMDIRQAQYHLGSITGEISTDDLLGNIFSNFCIGK